MQFLNTVMIYFSARGVNLPLVAQEMVLIGEKALIGEGALIREGMLIEKGVLIGQGCLLGMGDISKHFNEQ